MPSLSVNQWIHRLASEPYNQLAQLCHSRALSDVSINILQSGHVLKDSSFVHDFSITDQNILLFDVMYQNAQGDLVGVLIAKDASSHLSTIEKWAAFSSGKSDVGPGSVSCVEVYSHQGTKVASWSAAELSAISPETFDNLVMEEESDLSIEQLAQSLAMWRLLGQDAVQNAKNIEKEIESKINKQELDKQDTMDFGIARSILSKDFSLSKIDELVVDLMTQQSYPMVDIEKYYLKNPNFWHAAKFDQETLLDLIQMHCKVDVREDERFVSAISQEKTAHVNNRVDYLKDVAKKMGVEIDWDSLIDWENSTVKTEVVRESMTGSARHLRSSVVAALRDKVQPLIDHAAEQYTASRHAVLAAAPKKKTRKRR